MANQFLSKDGFIHLWQQMRSIFAKKSDVEEAITDVVKTFEAELDNHSHPNASASSDGLMSAIDKSKLDGIDEGANAYSLPTASSSTLGGVKTTSTVTSTSGLTACPIISGVPYYKDTNTTYSAATTSAAGLMSASDKSKLDGIATGANAYTHPSYTAYAGEPTTNQTPAFGGTFNIAQPVSDNKGHITAVNNRTVTMPNATATTAVSGLMSSDDKAKLDNIEEGANAYILPAAGTTLGGVKTGGSVTVASGIITVNDDSHNHIVANIDGLQSALDEKVSTSRTINGKSLFTDITLTSSDVGALPSTTKIPSIEGLASVSYVDEKVANMVDSAPETLDTLNELAAALGDDPNFATTVATQIGTKVDKVDGKGLSTNDYTDADKNKLSEIVIGAEVNQNAFSNISVGGTVIAADTKTDTLTLVAGGNVTLTPDSTNDKITITAQDTVYTHPTYTSKSTGLYKIAVDDTGHVSGAASVAKTDITALGIPAQDTTYSAATTSTAGLMSASDKSKLDSIESGATSYTLPPSSSTALGGLKARLNGSTLYLRNDGQDA